MVRERLLERLSRQGLPNLSDRRSFEDLVTASIQRSLSRLCNVRSGLLSISAESGTFDFFLRRQIDFSVSSTHVKSVFLGLNVTTSPLPYFYIAGLIQANQEGRLRAPALTSVPAHARLNQRHVSLQIGIENVLGESLIDRRNNVSIVHAHHAGRFDILLINPVEQKIVA